MNFPGSAAILPVFGTALIVAAPAQASDPSYRFLTSRAMRWIGTRSYSIYLWHWPLIVSLQLVLHEASEGARVAVALLAFPLAEVSYRFIETPVRQGIWWQQPLRTIAIFLTPFLALVAAWGVDRQTSWITEARRNLPFEETRMFNSLAEDPRTEYVTHMDLIGTDGQHGLCSLDQFSTIKDSRPCLKRATRQSVIVEQPLVLILGDSHGRDMFRTLGYAFAEAKFIMLHQSSCAPSVYSPRANRNCFPDLHDELPAVLADIQPDLVVLASHWPMASIAPTQQTLDVLSDWGGAIAIFGPGPKFEDTTIRILKSLGLAYDDLTPLIKLPARFAFDVFAARDKLADMAKDYGIFFYDRLSVLCELDGCLAFVPDSDLALINFDDQHLTLAGMQFLATNIKANPVLLELISGKPQ